METVMETPLRKGHPRVSMQTLVESAIHSTRSLYETTKRFKDHHGILRRLRDELEDLIGELMSLTQITNTEESILTMLQRPIERYNHICIEFRESMDAFSAKSKIGFQDWRKMSFMGGDINEFMDTIAGYKSTIAIGIGTITIHTSQSSHQALEEYKELIHDAAFDLQVHLQRIDEKLTHLTVETLNPSESSICNRPYVGHQFSDVRINGENRVHLGDSISVNHNHYYLMKFSTQRHRKVMRD
ncbi:hypothetical protein BGW36DRAFT_93859 [Talaromyces proteolyticus]|uniref:Azaphilone pigments biosynthesis cluster protein L N-terminal domain-containing protein n=1 Tax=Talaromyces proteolyticus TaxID=1131652 RepID=A0AAD4L0D0_9EURO|nr:uncharacterized protein BGW36DRAFT_93859 [Talaromyces proteolyticus]KAH8703919.1 hypothetical protein BGW36DRAFT_93859 [Talaromyces proteolyticus]